MVEIKIDFANEKGRIKPLHGINNSPVALTEPRVELASAGIPFCRLHDTAGQYGGTHYVDVPNVFPDFNADPNDPNSYDFAFTDAYLKQIVAAGMRPFYRLGVTIENNYKIKAYHTAPPADFSKWAEICAGIVRHYNEGWGEGGMKLGITYWEIWNEPENPPMWSGSREDFFLLYATAARRLRKEFPQIKIGGYGSCGFYAETRPDVSDFFRSFPVWFDDFLKFVREQSLPLDFISWHLYTEDPQEIVTHARYVAARLNAFGFANTENIFDEWNYISRKPGENVFERMKEAPGAAFVAAAFCLMQDSPIDKAMYYDALPMRSYCGLYYFPSLRVTRTYYSFKAFQLLYALGSEVASCVSGEDAVFALAAAQSGAPGEGAVLIVNCKEEPVELALSGIGSISAAFLTDREHVFAAMEGGVPSGFCLPPESVLLVCCGGAEKVLETMEQRAEQVKFAGLG
ncbi:MAG: hypothetical protein PHS41_06960 [Victivallaceae bacterium]|nr:hypothetical protein [Victivallaceae bacterium]